MPPQRSLVIEDVGSRLGIGCKHVVQNLAHAAACGLGLRTLDETLNVRGEDNSCHSSLSDALTRPRRARPFPPRSERANASAFVGLRHEFGPSMSFGHPIEATRHCVHTCQGRMNLANPDIVLQYRMPRGRPSKEVSERRRRALLPLAGKGWAEVMPFRTEVPLPTPTSAQKKPGASAVTSSLDPTPMR